MTDIAATVARSRAAQGLAAKVTDPATLRRITVLFAGRDVAPAGARATVNTATTTTIARESRCAQHGT